jgi:hypothetical protein
MKTQTWALPISLVLLGCGSSGAGGGGQTGLDGGAPLPSDLAPQALRQSVEPYDVSVLVPADADPAQLPSASALGARGELFPRALFAMLPRLQANGPDDLYASLRLVSVRVDPCFAAVEDRGDKCTNQVRLVLRSWNNAAGGVSDDGAIHLFYGVSREELTTLVATTVALRKDPPAQMGLGPHPSMKQEGMSGPFAKGYFSALLSFIGEANLTRIAFITREAARQPTWKFGSFDKASGAWKPLAIPTTQGATVQTIGGGLGFGPGTYDFKVDLPTEHADKTAALYSSEKITALGKAEVESAYDAALRIENPSKHSPETIDCASCHLSHARQTVEAQFALAPMGRPDAYPSALTPTGLISSARVHAFTYGEGGTQISQRVANETIAVVKYFNEKIVKR